MQAAALVTHYRHEHRLSYDRACSNPSYAAKIPNYDYETAKQTTNNQAKRQLLRAIRKLVATGTYPPNAPASAMDLVAGFGRLDWNEPKTDELIAATLAQLSGA
ncbi:MAG: hypothetical protein KDA44_22995 [Planctomycetales bacterium]|nr:hypothetical protein [Planctomycetales bacterium]